MTTLKKCPSKSGVNFRKSTFVESHFTPQRRLPEEASTATFFAEIVDLVKLNEPTGQLDEDTLVCDLQHFFEYPNVDKRNLHLWRDNKGKLVGFGQLFISEENEQIEGYLYFDVHPTQQGVLEAEILQWSEERLREVGKRSPLIKLRTRSRENRSLRQVLLEKQDFTTERRFLTMACSLNQPFSSSKLPTDFTLQQLSSEGDIKAWVEMFNGSFIDHWDHHELSIATVSSWLKNPHYKPELNWVAVAPDGTFAAFCVGYINQEENARTGRKEGWIKLLGTRRGFRKLGLGRSILLTCIKQLQAANIEQVKLGVDAQSLTSATRLYQGVGFEAVNTWLSYIKEVQL
jgi:ribosomal protein S18 acetylase RimI-like enzyme